MKIIMMMTNIFSMNSSMAMMTIIFTLMMTTTMMMMMVTYQSMKRPIIAFVGLPIGGEESESHLRRELRF